MKLRTRTNFPFTKAAAEKGLPSIQSLSKARVTATAEFSDPAVTRRLRGTFAESPAALEILRAKNPVFSKISPSLKTLRDMKSVYGVKSADPSELLKVALKPHISDFSVGLLSTTAALSYLAPAFGLFMGSIHGGFFLIMMADDDGPEEDMMHKHLDRHAQSVNMSLRTLTEQMHRKEDSKIFAPGFIAGSVGAFSILAGAAAYFLNTGAVAGLPLAAFWAAGLVLPIMLKKAIDMRQLQRWHQPLTDFEKMDPAEIYADEPRQMLPVFREALNACLADCRAPFDSQLTKLQTHRQKLLRKIEEYSDPNNADFDDTEKQRLLAIVNGHLATTDRQIDEFMEDCLKPLDAIRDETIPQLLVEFEERVDAFENAQIQKGLKDEAQSRRKISLKELGELGVATEMGELEIEHMRFQVEDITRRFEGLLLELTMQKQTYLEMQPFEDES